VNGVVQDAILTSPDVETCTGTKTNAVLNQCRQLRELKQNNEIKQSLAPNDAFVLFFVDGGNCFHVQNIKVLPLSASFLGGCWARTGPLTSPRFNPKRIQSGTFPTVALSEPNAVSKSCIARAVLR